MYRHLGSNKLKILTAVLLCATALLLWVPKSTIELYTLSPNSPIQLSERGKAKQVKQSWIELIHKSPANKDWRKIENRNRLELYEKSQHQIQERSGTIEIADGALKGRWKEKGSRNLAGSVLKTAYSRQTNTLYALADGGTIWKSDLEGNNWTVITDQLKFDHKNLEVLNVNGNDRILASINGVIYFSDDHINWDKSNISNNSGIIDQLIKLADSNQLFALMRGTSKVQLISSGDNGESFKTHHFYSTSNFNNVAISLSQNKKELFSLQYNPQNLRYHTFIWDHDSENLDPLAIYEHHADVESITNLSVSEFEGDYIFYRYDKFDFLYQSVDLGATWNRLNILPEKPWSIPLTHNHNIYISNSNHNLFVYGGIDLHISTNRGATWSRINRWQEYYEDPDTKLHADIMHLAEYSNLQNQRFFVISTHGGIYVSSNNLGVVRNISREGLNISEYYDVKSYPGIPRWIFGASQDQGIQRTYDIEEGVPNVFEQLVPGDFGHITFLEKNDSFHEMWLSYPEGIIHHHPNPLMNGQDYHSNPNLFTLPANSKQKTVWLAPLVAAPDRGSVLMAGGNINGGIGSHIIELKADQNENLQVFQWPFNFSPNMEEYGEISAISTNYFNTEIYYVATTNGKFFRSTDGGEIFREHEVVISGANFLYGSNIYPSKVNPDVLYVSGSGYENKAIYRSNDGGITFSPYVEGMPEETTVFEITGNEDETLLFAASESGPYVYIKGFGKWFHMSQLSAPNQAYWSVEYIAEKNTARFGTYGRGIWDFDIEFLTANESITEIPVGIDIYPNPVTDLLILRNEGVENIDAFSIYSMNGNYIFGERTNVSSKLQIPVSQLATGSYLIQTRINDQYFINKFVKI